MFRQLTEEEYDLEFLEARRERLIKGIPDDMPDYEFIDIGNNSKDSGQKVVTRKSFLRDLQKASRKLDKPKPSPKSS